MLVFYVYCCVNVQVLQLWHVRDLTVLVVSCGTWGEAPWRNLALGPTFHLPQSPHLFSCPSSPPIPSPLSSFKDVFKDPTLPYVILSHFCQTGKGTCYLKTAQSITRIKQKDEKRKTKQNKSNNKQLSPKMVLSIQGFQGEMKKNTQQVFRWKIWSP